jgi:toprim domain protein
MALMIIVEGKNDRSRLRKLLSSEVDIVCTYGTPGTDQLERIKKQAGDAQVFIFTDNDASGRRIRALLSDALIDAEHIYTKRGYAGVEGTPDEYLIQQLEKAGLEEYINYSALGETGE